MSKTSSPGPDPDPEIRRAQSDRTLHLIFLLTLACKGALGAIQLATATFLAVGGVDRLPALVQRLVRAELAEDPGDFVAAKLLDFAGRAPTADTGFYTLYFAAHGGLHVLVVAALLLEAAWAYPVTLLVLCAFVVYQLAEWFAVGGAMLIVLSAIDLAVIALTLAEWRERRPS